MTPPARESPRSAAPLNRDGGQGLTLRTDQGRGSALPTSCLLRQNHPTHQQRERSGESSSCRSQDGLRLCPGRGGRRWGDPGILKHHSPPQPRATRNQVISHILPVES